MKMRIGIAFPSSVLSAPVCPGAGMSSTNTICGKQPLPTLKNHLEAIRDIQSKLK